MSQKVVMFWGKVGLFTRIRVFYPLWHYKHIPHVQDQSSVDVNIDADLDLTIIVTAYLRIGS